jgi:hypothetical protein
MEPGMNDVGFIHSHAIDVMTYEPDGWFIDCRCGWGSEGTELSTDKVQLEWAEHVIEEYNRVRTA